MANVPAALVLLPATRVDVVFTDVLLPGGQNGFDLVRIMKTRWPELPVLLTSGFDKSENEVPPGLTADRLALDLIDRRTMSAGYASLRRYRMPPH